MKLFSLCAALLLSVCRPTQAHIDLSHAHPKHQYHVLDTTPPPADIAYEVDTTPDSPIGHDTPYTHCIVYFDVGEFYSNSTCLNQNLGTIDGRFDYYNTTFGTALTATYNETSAVVTIAYLQPFVEFINTTFVSNGSYGNITSQTLYSQFSSTGAGLVLNVTNANNITYVNETGRFTSSSTGSYAVGNGIFGSGYGSIASARSSSTGVSSSSSSTGRASSSSSTGLFRSSSSSTGSAASSSSSTGGFLAGGFGISSSSSTGSASSSSSTGSAALSSSTAVYNYNNSFLNTTLPVPTVINGTFFNITNSTVPPTGASIIGPTSVATTAAATTEAATTTAATTSAPTTAAATTAINGAAAAALGGAAAGGGVIGNSLGSVQQTSDGTVTSSTKGNGNLAVPALAPDWPRLPDGSPETCVYSVDICQQMAQQYYSAAGAAQNVTGTNAGSTTSTTTTLNKASAASLLATPMGMFSVILPVGFAGLMWTVFTHSL